MTVRITIPEFQSEYSQLLNDVLCDMGIADAFSDAADFSRMTEEGSSGDGAEASGKSSADGVLKIGNVLHKTFIELDAEGTRAAAVTEIEMVSDAAAVDIEYLCVCLDRPFVYVIMDMENNLPVFIGVLNTVE